MTKALILVGPKGAGKSFVGRLLERELSIPFLRVEPIWLEITRRDPAIGPQDFIRVGAPAIWEEAKRLAEEREPFRLRAPAAMTSLTYSWTVSGLLANRS